MTNILLKFPFEVAQVPKCKNIRFGISQDREKQERFYIHTLHFNADFKKNIFTRSPFRQ